MVILSGPFSRLQSGKALVIGDLMLDTYTIGKVARISPEAPVPVLHVTKEETRPGGAGNVALTLEALGMDVTILGRVGYDRAGNTLKTRLEENLVNICAVVSEKGYQTTIKNRIVAGSQQIIRVDHEVVTPLPEHLEQAIIENLPSLFEDVEVVAISDYAKGFLSPIVLAEVISLARKKGIPVLVDPKGIDFTKYKGATLIKPNLLEARAASHASSKASLDEIAERLLKESESEMIFITRSEEGISVFPKRGERKDFGVKIKNVKDVTGAGDTVLATLACALASGLEVEEAAQLANVAAGIAIEHLGCYHVTLSDLAKRLLEFDIVNKVFEEEHLFALEQLIKDKEFVVLGLHGKDGITTEVFRSINKLSENGEADLIVYVRDQDPDPEFVTLLASLKGISYIVLKNDSLKKLASVINPSHVYVVENDALVLREHAEALLSGFVV